MDQVLGSALKRLRMAVRPSWSKAPGGYRRRNIDLRLLHKAYCILPEGPHHCSRLESFRNSLAKPCQSLSRDKSKQSCGTWNSHSRPYSVPQYTKSSQNSKHMSSVISSSAITCPLSARVPLPSVQHDTRLYSPMIFLWYGLAVGSAMVDVMVSSSSLVDVGSSMSVVDSVVA